MNNSSIEDRIKKYRDPEKISEKTHSPYMPQYKVLGVQPEEYKSPSNPRTRLPSMRSPILPNVGNKMEHTWSGMDAETISDDISGTYIDPNHPMIDNNDYISISSSPPPNAEDVSINNKSLSLNQEYMLFINNTFFASGSLDVIQEEVKLLVFGEHKICNGESISPDMLHVYKKIKIKVGVFLE